MDVFKQYLIDEYKDSVKGYAAVEFKFTHSSNIKIDKKSSVPLKIDVIKVHIKFVDKNLHVMKTSIITFENNALTKCNAKKLINIAPKELENKFNVAKREICNVLMNELVRKSNEINEKINDLQKYIGVEGIIPSEFKGEVVTVVDENEAPQRIKNKVQFDM